MTGTTPTEGMEKTMFQTTTRNASLADLFEMLQRQQARKHDVVVPARAISARDGLIVVRGSQAVLTPEGVSSIDGTYRPTAVFDEGIASKLGIQLSYLRRLRAERRDIYDANVNGWLHGAARTLDGQRQVIVPGDDRQFLLRLFTSDTSQTSDPDTNGEDGCKGGIGIGRAFLSDKYARIENLDILMTVLEALRASGIDVEIAGGDLSDRRMYVRVKAPAVQALAPALLANYRSPFTGARGADNPTVFAGFEISNSEVGNGAFSITPRLIVEVCENGMKLTRDALRAVHLGGRLDEGVIAWTGDTQRKALELIKAKTRDAVTTFLDVDYMTRAIEGLTRRASVKLPDPQATIRTLSKKLAFDKHTAAGILSHFIQGADITAGGVLHAVTSFAQTLHDADDAADLESTAVRAMELAASA